MNVNISRTERLIKKLNNILTTKCGELLFISIYSGINLTPNILSETYDKNNQIDFIICLNHKISKVSVCECVSSISCKINSVDNSVEFSSKTNEIYEKKKYNLILRSALIMLCPYITYNRGKSINSIVSNAINPISIYLMVKYFNAYNTRLVAYMNENGITNEMLTYKHAEDFYNQDISELDDAYDSDDEDYEARMMESLKNNSKFGNPVKLTIDLHDETYIINAKNLFNNIEIICPGEGVECSNKSDLRINVQSSKKRSSRLSDYNLRSTIILSKKRKIRGGKRYNRSKRYKRLKRG
jgi:hypothetical protein